MKERKRMRLRTDHNVQILFKFHLPIRYWCILRTNHIARKSCFEWVVPYLIYHLTGRLVIVFKTEVQEFTLRKFSLLFFFFVLTLTGTICTVRILPLIHWLKKCLKIQKNVKCKYRKVNKNESYIFLVNAREFLKRLIKQSELTFRTRLLAPVLHIGRVSVAITSLNIWLARWRQPIIAVSFIDKK